MIGVSRSNAAASPRPHASRKPVISLDSVVISGAFDEGAANCILLPSRAPEARPYATSLPLLCTQSRLRLWDVFRRPDEQHERRDGKNAIHGGRRGGPSGSLRIPTN